MALTVEQYSNRPEGEISHPRNGEGLQMPQLIDDLINARQDAIDAKTVAGYGNAYVEATLELAIGHLNRALMQLGIEI